MSTIEELTLEAMGKAGESAEKLLSQLGKGIRSNPVETDEVLLASDLAHEALLDDYQYEEDEE